MEKYTNEISLERSEQEFLEGEDFPEHAFHLAARSPRRYHCGIIF
jgi:hypothetical protein